jgi:molybdenum cofactor synthesis domain-containing protein
MKPFGTLIPFSKASQIITTNIKPILRTETIHIDDCLNRVLAEDFIATRNTPPFNRAAMDGYAVKAKDTFGASRENPKLFNMVDVLYAGSVPQKKVAAGECIQIATGAVLPVGADAVVMIEDVDRKNRQVKIFKPLYPRANIALKGEDVKKGELILAQGTLLAPAKIGVITSQGMRHVRVYEKPKVMIVPTGEEIGELGKKLRQGQVYDINSYTLSAVVEESGCLPVKSHIVSDNITEIKTTISEALKSDFVIISGGSSVGERDLLFGILNEWGNVLFHGVQIKPGKPTMFAIVKEKPVMGMPGYPTSCMMNAYIFLKPALRKLAHLPPKKELTISAKLSERVLGSVGRRQFLPVMVEAGIARPIFKESGTITGTAKANGYIVVVENIDILEKGEPVTVTFF